MRLSYFNNRFIASFLIIAFLCTHPVPAHADSWSTQLRQKVANFMYHSGAMFGQVFGGMSYGILHSVQRSLTETQLLNEFKRSISPQKLHNVGRALITEFMGKLQPVVSSAQFLLSRSIGSMVMWGLVTLSFTILHRVVDLIYLGYQEKMVKSELAIEKSKGRIARLWDIFTLQIPRALFRVTGITFVADQLGIIRLFEKIGLYDPKAEEKETLQSLVLNNKTREEAEDLIEMLENAAKFNKPYPTPCFAGPPGTGKTALARAILKTLAAREELQWGKALTVFLSVAGLTYCGVSLVNWGAAKMRQMKFGVNGPTSPDLIKEIFSKLYEGSSWLLSTHNMRKVGPVRFNIAGTASLLLGGLMGIRALIPKPWSFVIFSGGDVFKYKGNQGIDMLGRLFELGERQGKFIFVIDECEAFLRDRESQESTAKQREAITKFLAHTSDKSKEVVVMIITNQAKVLDPAVARRVDMYVYVGLPQQPQREKLFKTYFRQYFLSQAGLTIKDHFLNNRYVRGIAERTKGLSGAEIEGICRIAAMRAGVRADQTLTPELLESIIDETMKKNARIIQKWQYEEEAEAGGSVQISAEQNEEPDVLQPTEPKVPAFEQVPPQEEDAGATTLAGSTVPKEMDPLEKSAEASANSRIIPYVKVDPADVMAEPGFV